MQNLQIEIPIKDILTPEENLKVKGGDDKSGSIPPADWAKVQDY